MPLDDVRGDQLRDEPAGPDRHLLDARTATKYEFLFVAKGGGSANKSMLFQETKALLNPRSLETFLDEKLRSLGTAACPPYHLAVVIGGTSAEATMKTVKLAQRATSTRCRPRDKLGQAFRDRELEEQVMELARRAGSAPSSAASTSPRRPGDPAPAPRRFVPGGHRRLVLGRPQHQGQDRPRRRLARGAGDRPAQLPPRDGGRRISPATASRSTSTGRWPRSSPSSRSTRSRPR